MDGIDKLYQGLSAVYDLGTPEDFRAKIADEQHRKNLYDQIIGTVDLGVADYDEFSKKVNSYIQPRHEFPNLPDISNPIPTFGNDATRQDQTRMQDYETRIPEEVKQHNAAVERRMEELQPQHEAMWAQDRPLIDEIYQQAQKDANDEYMRAAQEYSVMPINVNGGEISNAMNMERRANEKRDPAKLIAAFNNRLDERMKERFPDMKDTAPASDSDLAFQLGKTPEDYQLYKDYVMRQLQQYFTDVNMPKSQLEYFARKVIQGNILGQLYEIGTKPLAQRQFEMQGLQQYASQNNTTGSDIGAEITNVVTDPLMWLMPEVGGLAGKAVVGRAGRKLFQLGLTDAAGAAERAAMQRGILRTAKGLTSGGVMMAGIDTGHTLVGQLYQSGEVDWKEVGKSALRGAATGVAFGTMPFLGERVQKVIGDAYGRSVGLVAGRAAQFTAGTNIMVGSSVLSHLMNGGSLEDVDWGSEYAHAAAMQLFFDVQGGLKTAINAKGFGNAWRLMKQDPTRYNLTKEEIEQFNAAGIEGKDAYNILKNLNGGKDFTSVDEYYKVLNDISANENIDTQAKYKLASLLYGQVEANLRPIYTSDVIQDEQGRYVVRTFDYGGMSYETRYFTSKAKAQEYRQKQYDKTRNNLRTWQEGVVSNYQFAKDLQDVADEAILEIQKQYPQYSKEQLYSIMREALLNPKAKSGRAIAQSTEADAIRGMFEEYLASKSKTPAFFNILSAVRAQAASDSGISAKELGDIISRDYSNLDYKERGIYDNYLRRLAEAMPNPTSESTHIAGELEAGGPEDYYAASQQPPVQPSREDLIRQEVTNEVASQMHNNGYVYPVKQVGVDGKAGFIVGNGEVVVDTTNPERPRISNDDIVTVKYEDGTVEQVSARTLDLLSTPEPADNIINSMVKQRLAADTQQAAAAQAAQNLPEGVVEFTNGNETMAVVDNGDGTYQLLNSDGTPDANSISAEQLAENGYAMIPSEQVVEQPAAIQEPQQPAAPAPIIPNIETMSAEELGASAVEYMGDKASATAYLEAERDKADDDVKRTAKLKVGRFDGIEDFKRQNDQIQAAKRAAIDRYNKLQNAITAANAYKTLAEQKEEAERKAREAELREQRRQLAEAESAGDIEAKWQNTKKTVGFAATKTLPNGQKVNGHYILTEAGDVIPSHDPRKNYADSEGYVMENGQNVNDNNYKDPEVQKIANDIAQNYGGQAVEQMPFLENKAGRVLSGNNRTISGIIAAENNTDQAYLAALAENAQQFGFTPEQLAEYQHPRLQFVVEDELPFTTGTFAMFNQQEKKTKSSVNRAIANSKMVTEAVRDKMLEVMDQYDSLDSFFGSENAAADIVQSLISEGLMTQQEVAGLTENTGTGFKFSQSGREYVTDMLLGTLFDEQTIRMLAGEKTLKQAILRALPSIVENRRLKGYELTESINKAVQILYEARKANEGKSTEDAFQLFLRQVDAFEGKVTDRFDGFDIILANRMSAGVEQLREMLNLYNNSARDEANGQMGFFEPRSSEDIKQDVYEYYTKQQPDLAAALNGAAEEGTQSKSPVSSGTADAGEVRPTQREQLTEYLNGIADEEHKPILFDNSTLVETLRNIGATPDAIAEAQSLVVNGGHIEGFYLNGYVCLDIDNLPNAERARTKYVHERQHDLTRKDIKRVKEVMDVASESELKSLLEEFSNSPFYNKKKHSIVADEFISFAMEEAYKAKDDAELESALRAFGVKDELIDIIKSINNEQRGIEAFAMARRNAPDNHSAESSSRESSADSGTQSEGGLGREGFDTDQQSLRRTEGRGDEVPAAGEVSSTKFEDTEIGGALVDRLEDMGVSVSTDLQANRDALKAAKADKSEAGAIHYYKTPSGQQYGFSYKGKVYLDPTKINAELPLHEYGHLWAEALRRLNPENWQRVVETIKADKDAWAFVRELRPELTDENEIAEEVIATFSGKNGAEKMRAEYERMHGKDADYKSKWGNIFKNISKAIQDFWKAVGDFLNIKYESAEQVYDQVLKDFVDNMNPWKRVSDFFRQRDAEYVQAAESGDIKTATNIFYEALKENIGNGITPYMSVGTYNNLKRLAKGVKTRDAALIKEAADLIAPLIPDNAVLIPAPSHSGTATDMLDLAKAIAEVTGSEVADVLRSAPRESQYQAKKTTGVPMASKQFGIAVEGDIPADKTPIIIDNVVDSGNTAEACVQAVGKGVVVTLADSAEQYGHAASLKSAAPVLRDKDGKVIPLSKRFDLSGSRYLGRRMYLRPDDLRLSVSGTQTIPVGKNTLVGLHNISAEKLRKALKMGGLANPSTAVIDIARQNHEQYGDISLIMPSSLVDSKTGRNAGTFTGDIWSPTYPSVERIMSDKGDEAYYQAITKAFGDNEARRPILSRAKLDFDDYLESGNVRAGLAYWYLLEKGIEPGDVYFNSGISDDIKERFRPLYDKGILELTKEDYRTLLSLIAEQQGKTAEDMLQDAQESKARYQQTIDDPEAKQFYKKIAQQAIDEIDLYGVRYNVLSNGYHAMERAIRNDGKINLDSTLIAAQDIVQTQHQADFDKWLSDMDKRFDIKEVLFEDYDRDGNRIYKPHTLANASRMMNKEDLQNAGDHSGLGATRGQLVERMETLADIRANKERLRPGAEEDFETDEWNKMQDEWFNKVLNPLSDMQKISDNPFSNVGYAETRLQEALRTKDPIAHLNKEYGYHIAKDSQWAKDLADMVERVKNLPTKYFETKFRRPVYLNEFANAVVPVGLPQDLRDGLTGAGMTLFEYDPAEQGSRRAATLKATADEGIRFSISGNTRNRYADEMESIKNEAVNNGTFMQAPNGKPTNLDERQWLQVRLHSFKRWFGDWENDPQNASKILDENGEPMVAKHGTPFTFTTFDKSKQQQNDAGWLGRGFYFFTKNDDYAAGYARGGQVINAFLNIKDPYYATYADMERLAEMDSKEESERFTKGLIDEGYDGVYFDANLNGEWVAFDPNQIKSATDNNGDFSEENDDIRFSISNQNNDIFYSNAERAVEGIKQEKATPEQWRAMIEKAGGLKAGEDKWIGLSDWLAQQRPTVELQPNETRSQYIVRLGEASKKFTISKQDILDYIRQNKIQIEEVEYDENEYDVLYLDRKKEFKRYYDEAVDAGEEEPQDVAWQRMIDEYGDDFELAYWAQGDELMRDNDSDYAQWEDDAEGYPRNINETRLTYTTEGLENKREIALTVPTIESWNENDEIHFGDAGEGRAIAWVRFGDTHKIKEDWTDGEGNLHKGAEALEDVLVIDEIQSKRHQEGRDKGYYDGASSKELMLQMESAEKAYTDYLEGLREKYGVDRKPELFGKLSEEEAAEADRLNEAANNARRAWFASSKDAVPAAPFEKNWHELAMKRILRFAAENGYDKVAWTTGEQQAKRYDIGKEIDHIVKTDENTYEVYPTSGLMMTLEFDENGMYADEYDREYNGKSMSDIFGKDLAKRLKEMPVDETLQGDGLRVGYDGMKGFYDDILPRFMQKYGKKWGVQVSEVTMPDLEDGYQTMHSVDITPEMRESVLQGQPMFSVTGSRGAANIDKMEGVTTRMDNLAAARQMEEDGKDAKTIRMATGWERGADGKWRYEIDDVQLNTDNVKANFRKLDRRGVTAPMVWYHNKFTDIIADSPERKQLLAAYPQLADLDIEFYDYPNKERGAYSSEKKQISVNRANVRSVDECRSVLLHEIQHAIQEAELFAKGTSKEQIQLTWKLNNEVHNKVDEYFDKMGFKEWLTSHNGDKAFVDRLMQVIHMFPNRDFNIHYLFVETLPRDKQIDAIDVLGDANDVIQSNRDAIYGADRKGMTMKPDELYHNAAGEVESRNVQNRMKLTPDERRERLLAETEDVAREDQVVIMNAFDMAEEKNMLENLHISDKIRTFAAQIVDNAKKLIGNSDSRTQRPGRDSGRVSYEAARRMAATADRGDIRVLEPELPVSDRVGYFLDLPRTEQRARTEAESQRLIGLAKENGLFIERKDTEKFGTKKNTITRESTVYEDKEHGKHIKVKDPYALAVLKGNYPEDAIYEHIIHNLLFPDTRYTFMGISEDLGDVRFVLSQETVDAIRNATDKEVDAYMKRLGLRKADKYTYENDMVRVTDVTGDNALVDKDGHVRFIDPVISLKVPARQILNEVSDAAMSDFTMDAQPWENKVQYAARIAEEIKRENPKDTSLDEAIRFSITVNHNSPYLLKRADGAFVDPETGERLGFDLRFMGSGEGNQAHGYGSYFSVRDLRKYAKNAHSILYKGEDWRSFEDDIIRNALGWVYTVVDNNRRIGHNLTKDNLLRALKQEETRLTGYTDPAIVRHLKNLQNAEEWVKENLDDISIDNRHHYTVSIPDNDGTNYIEEREPMSDRVRKAIMDGLIADGYTMEDKDNGEFGWYEFNKGDFREDPDNQISLLKEDETYKDFIHDNFHGYDSKMIARVSKYLSDAGVVGIHYFGNLDGECYVIFNPDDAVITDHIRFSVTGGANDKKGIANEDDQIRSDNFKAWFGDWQNDPEHASKVVDADGKPLVVEHSTPKEFTTFDIDKLGKNSGDRGIFGAGFYFGDRGNTDIYGKNHMQVYLNMRKPFVMEDYMPDDISAFIVEHFNTPALRKIVLNENGKSITVGEYIDIVNAVNAEMEEGKHDAEIERISSFYRPDSARRQVRDDAIADKSFLIPGSLNYLISTMIGSQEFTNALRENGNDGVIVGKGSGYNEYVVFSPNQIKSATKNNGEFSKYNNDIRFSVNNPSTLSRSETVTKALVQQANNNYNIMQSALKKVTADLKGIRAAMRMQSDYDRKVVDALLNLYNTLLQENGVWAQYMPDTTRRIATQIVHAIGKQNITEEVNTIMDHMVHAQAKAAQRQWDKLRQTPIDKINISGVVMQGKVALEGQHALKALNEVLDPENGITLLTLRGDHTDPNKEVDGLIDQLMQMEDNATDESQKLQYKGQWIGYEIAAQYLERIQHIQEERKQLDLELKKAQGNMALKPAARKQLVESIKQAMRDNYLDQADAYMQSTRDLQEYVSTQEVRAKDFIRRQDANRDKIRSYAQRDLEGLATNPNRNRTRGNIVRQIWDAFASPIRDLQSLLRLTGLHAPDGEGYLYNHFMRGWMDGADKERTGIVAASKTLDEKIAELTHGKYKTWEEAARKINDASHNMFGITMLNGVDGKDMPVTEEIPLNAGNALYIYAVNKMNDGRMKLNGMNITEEDVQALADKVREQFGQEILDVVDWIQSEFFSQLRNRYNPTHEALFGAPMDAIENYFPLRINANARQQNEDLSEPDTDAARLLAGTSTGAIKRRTRNSLPLDVRNADFFQEVIRHISQMERWNAFAQWNRDANILFSDINFRNRIKGMKGTIYGEGDKLYNYMKDAFRVAIGTYKPKTDTFSEITLNMAKGVTSAKINFRIFTALKQIASFPAFFTYMQDGVFVQSYLRNWLKPHETMKWAKENLPNFEKRVSKRDMGDMRLMQRSTDWQWNKRILEWSSKYGMFFNVFFDTLTCATGARAVYDSHLADYMKKGYSEEDARNRARQDAEQAFNTSQQSSEGAFMSAVQQDRNLVTAALTVFRTSPIQYTRNFMYHTRNLLRKFGEGKRDEQIAFRMGQYKNDGLNDEQARKAAEKDYNKSIRQDIVGFVVYGALLNILWRLVGQVPYLLRGDDDDKKKQILDDATSGGAWFSPFTGLLGGGIVESALDGNGSVADMFAPEMPFTQDIKRAGQYLSNDKYAEFASQALSVLMQSGTGFDPLTASDMVSRIVTTLDSEEELDAATQALRVSQALLSIPQSQYEQMLIDKVVSGETDEDAALEDFVRYYKVHRAPLTFFLRNEENDIEAEENAATRFNMILNERDKLHNPEDYEE